jgi:hypothetical protein
MNQYGIIEPEDADYGGDTTSDQSKANFNSHWPKSMGQAFSTKLEQDQEDGDYVFNLMLTQEEVDRMPKNDNPNFVFQYEGELDSEDEPLPTPTFKVKIMDDSEPPVWTGNYREQTICKQ